MTITDRHLLDARIRMPIVESTDLGLIPAELRATVHRRLSELLADGVVERVTHGTVHLPSSGKYCLTRGHQRGRRIRRLRHALGLRTGLPQVQGTAHVAHPLDGRGGHQSRIVDRARSQPAVPLLIGYQKLAVRDHARASSAERWQALESLLRLRVQANVDPAHRRVQDGKRPVL